jgi:hypothetical protein
MVTAVYDERTRGHQVTQSVASKGIYSVFAQHEGRKTPERLIDVLPVVCSNAQIPALDGESCVCRPGHAANEGALAAGARSQEHWLSNAVQNHLMLSSGKIECGYCTAGQHPPLNAFGSVKDCRLCPAGFASPDGYKCDRCTPGHMPSNGKTKCDRCDTAEQKVSPDGLECTSCPHSTVANENSTTCMPCPSNAVYFHSAPTDPVSIRCIQCEDGAAPAQKQVTAFITRGEDREVNFVNVCFCNLVGNFLLLEIRIYQKGAAFKPAPHPQDRASSNLYG